MPRWPLSTTIVVAVCAFAILAFGAVQLVPAERVNPPMTSPLVAPPIVSTILMRSCADCHSNRTRWPWYAKIAPISWIAIRDVRNGRRQVNFSQWGAYNARTRRHKLEWMGRTLRAGTMPPLYYQLEHPGSRVTTADRETILRWIDADLAPAKGIR